MTYAVPAYNDSESPDIVGEASEVVSELKLVVRGGGIGLRGVHGEGGEGWGRGMVGHGGHSCGCSDLCAYVGGGRARRSRWDGWREGVGAYENNGQVTPDNNKICCRFPPTKRPRGSFPPFNPARRSGGITVPENQSFVYRIV